MENSMYEEALRLSEEERREVFKNGNLALQAVQGARLAELEAQRVELAGRLTQSIVSRDRAQMEKLGAEMDLLMRQIHDVRVGN